MAAPDAPPEVKAAEWKVLAQMNRLRERHGLKPLRMAGGVRLVARERSRSMKNKDYFAHTSPAGVDAGDLLRNRSVPNSFWGENIGWTKYVNLDEGPKVMVDWWKDSPGHRYNMLYKDYNYAGVGVAKDGAETYWTIVFANQRDHTPPLAGLMDSLDRHVRGGERAARGRSPSAGGARTARSRPARPACAASTSSTAAVTATGSSCAPGPRPSS